MKTTALADLKHDDSQLMSEDLALKSAMHTLNPMPISTQTFVVRNFKP